MSLKLERKPTSHVRHVTSKRLKRRNRVFTNKNMDEKLTEEENHENDILSDPKDKNVSSASAVLMEPIRKSQRPKKVPGHFLPETVTPRPISTAQRRIIKNPIRPNLIPDFRCDHCGSRYVVNPMRRGNKAPATPRYKAAPRRKIDPETLKILTLCNACGLKFNRTKKNRKGKGLTEEEKKQFQDEGQSFARELAVKLNNHLACRLFCSSVRKNACGCIQKYICGLENTSVEDILERAKNLLDILTTALELRKVKFYSTNKLEPGRSKPSKIGLGNGHRKSKEYEQYVLSKRGYLKTAMKICEKGSQKLLSYSNNFLHKRMKTDPDKGIRIERQKGKGVLGRLRPIQDLPLEACCIDNCVRIALTHHKLLESWRQRALGGQVERRRVLAEMLTPSGGNRANCYRFISAVTGCSNTTIGKVNEQMRNTGGDREPPEHGLKKYWKEKPTPYVPPYQILQTAATSAGLSSVMQNMDEACATTSTSGVAMTTSSPVTKKRKAKEKKKVVASTATTTHQEQGRFITILADSAEQSNIGNVQNLPTVLTLNPPTQQYNQFISIPTNNTVTIPNIQSNIEQQLEHQQQLHLQIQILQQQLQNSQAAVLSQTQQQQQQQQQQLQQSGETRTDFSIVSNQLEISGIHTAPIVVQTVTPQPLIHNVISQPLVPNLVNSPNLLNPVASINFATGSILRNNEQTQNVSLITSPLSTNNELNIITPSNGVNILTSVSNTLRGDTTTVITPRQTVEETFTTRRVHLITSQSPTMALTPSQPLSLQNPLATTMLLAPSTTHPAPPTAQLVIHQSTTQQPSSFILHPPTTDLLLPAANPTHTTTPPSPSILPPITSFNADAFLTGSTFTVLNTSSVSPN